MKTSKEISEITDSIMNTIKIYLSEGGNIGTFRWLKEHGLLGNVQKESKHELRSIQRMFIEANVKNLTDYHIV